MITREKIRDGVYFTSAEYNYKRSRLGVYLSFPASRETQTETALLPYVLERGTSKYPDKILLGRKLLSLYGADLKCNYNQYGSARLVSVVMSGADAGLLPDGEQVASQRAQLLCDLLCDPVVQNSGFTETWVNVEREKLRETIRSLINDKREYCLRNLTDCLYANDARSLAPDGYEEDLDGITGKTLYSVYESMLSRCNVEIIYAGGDVASARSSAVEIANRIPNVGVELIHPGAVKKQKTVVIEKALDVEQDKLALGFTTGETLTHEQLCALRVGSMLLGGTATSRLFTNVREKQSLCYYVSSSASYESGGGAVIECGVAHENLERAQDAILAELSNLAEHGPTPKEMDETRLTIKNAFDSVRDSSSAISSFLHTTVVREGELVTPEMLRDELLSVTGEQAQCALQKLSLSCISRIVPDGGRQ